MKLALSIFLAYFTGAVTSPVTDLTTAQRFLKDFGYMKGASKLSTFSTKTIKAASTVQDVHVNLQGIDSALRLFQANFGLKITGELDEATMEMMNTPRCGLKDVDVNVSPRLRRYVEHGSKWPKQDLTFFIQKYTSDLSKDTVDYEVTRAFKDWGEVSNLKFHSVSELPADIVVVFGSRNHGDPYPFDGPGRVLAHAFYPAYGGDVHFDDDETWTSQLYHGTNLYQVALHEIGHSLGLKHSTQSASIMYPAYFGYRPNAGLDKDDIMGIQSIYGEPSRSKTSPMTSSRTTSGLPSTPETTPTTTTTTTTTAKTSTTTTTTTTTTKAATSSGLLAPSACQVDRWDAVLTTRDEKTYFFKGDYYYEKGFSDARRISDGFEGVHGRVDSALTMSSGYSLIIQGEFFWVFLGQNRYDYTPRKIGNYFGILTSTADAAWTWSKDRTFYLTKNGQVWRNNNDFRLDETYPRTLTDEFPGVPQNPDAATTDAQGITHFFSGRYYYTLDNVEGKVTQPPRLITNDWFPCNINELRESPSVVRRSASRAASVLGRLVSPSRLSRSFHPSMNAVSSASHLIYTSVFLWTSAFLYFVLR